GGLRGGEAPAGWQGIGRMERVHRYLPCPRPTCPWVAEGLAESVGWVPGRRLPFWSMPPAWPKREPFAARSLPPPALAVPISLGAAVELRTGVLAGGRVGRGSVPARRPGDAGVFVRVVPGVGRLGMRPML